MASSNQSRTSYPLLRASMPLEAIGQIGGHVKRGCPHPKGKRTKASMALVSALPLAPDSDLMVVSFMDRSDPSETLDRHPHHGDNAVVIMPRSELHLSIVNGVNPGDWKGAKVVFGKPIIEPVDLDVDATDLDITASDAWVDMVDDLGCDCTKVGGFPLWANVPVEVEHLCKKELIFHHRITPDLVDLKLGDGGVVYVFVTPDHTGGALCWQQAK